MGECGWMFSLLSTEMIIHPIWKYLFIICDHNVPNTEMVQSSSHNVLTCLMITHDSLLLTFGTVLECLLLKNCKINCLSNNCLNASYCVHQLLYYLIPEQSLNSPWTLNPWTVSFSVFFQLTRNATLHSSQQTETENLPHGTVVYDSMNGGAKTVTFVMLCYYR